MFGDIFRYVRTGAKRSPKPHVIFLDLLREKWRLCYVHLARALAHNSAVYPSSLNSENFVDDHSGLSGTRIIDHRSSVVNETCPYPVPLRPRTNVDVGHPTTFLSSSLGRRLFLEEDNNERKVLTKAGGYVVILDPQSCSRRYSGSK